jgi:hypothetical protein
MSDPLSDRLFVVADRRLEASPPRRRLARDLGLKEAWFRDTIFENPELVIAPCRAAGLTEDDWYPWAREYRVGVGAIDVLLISSQGKVAIVETKLSGNPELRRRVLAQALDYLSHLPEALDAAPPGIPMDEGGNPVAEVDDIRASVEEGEVLVIIVSDHIDDRVAKLSRTLIGDHLIKQWDLVLLDLALFKRDHASQGDYWVMPCIRGLVVAEKRQVVRVIVEGENPRARVEVVQIPDDPGPSRQKWDERRYFEQIYDKSVPREVGTLAGRLRDLAGESPDSLKLTWGTGRKGSMVLKRKDNGLVELYTTGELRFRPWRFAGGLGDEVALEYRRDLNGLFPDLGKYKYISPSATAAAAPALFGIIRNAIERADERESTVD